MAKLRAADIVKVTRDVLGDGTLWAKPPGAGQRSREGVRASSTSRVVLYKSPSVHSTDSELNIDIIDTEKGSHGDARRTPGVTEH